MPNTTLERGGTRIYCRQLRHIRAAHDVTSPDPHKGSKTLGHIKRITAPREYRRQESDWQTVIEMERANEVEASTTGDDDAAVAKGASLTTSSG